MNEAQVIRALLLFYITSLGNEKLAKQATIKSLKKIKRKVKIREERAFQKLPSLIVEITNKYFSHYKSNLSALDSFSSEFKFCGIPFDFTAWKHFYSQANEDECLTLIWSKILNISEEDIVAGLGLSESTVRYRTGHALKLLASQIENTKNRNSTQLAPKIVNF